MDYLTDCKFSSPVSLGLAVAVHTKLLKRVYAETVNFSNQHHLQCVIQPALQQVKQQHGRHFLKRKIRFYLLFPPINKCWHIFIIPAVSWHLKHPSWERYFLVISNRHRGWDRMYLFYPQLLQMISSTFCPSLLLCCHFWLHTLKVLSFPSLYARWGEKKGSPSLIEMGICSSHTAPEQGWTGQAHDRASLLFPQPQEWSRTTHSFCNSWKCFYRWEDYTGRHTSSVHLVCHITRRTTLLTCKGAHVLGVLIHVCLSFPLLSLETKFSNLNSVSADSCLYPNWALGSAVSLRKQRETHQHRNCFSVLRPEKKWQHHQSQTCTCKTTQNTPTVATFSSTLIHNSGVGFF